MSVLAKICGITDESAMRAAVINGANFVGLVFYPPSPRSLDAMSASRLVSLVPPSITKVGLFVNPINNQLNSVLNDVSLDLIQLHGEETPERCNEIRKIFGLPVMKVIKVSNINDIEGVSDYYEAVDWLMFDAKAPDSMDNALPGGNALKFDWNLLAGRNWSLPWMLAGGLNAENVGTAVAESGAMIVDVSSGVESSPGEKDPLEIERFMQAVLSL
ncbi:MAG: phosphoribosylanthranilate isomerase [Rhodospirillaceae bacterium]|nr:phosphoribosylanthranilate isomerase [Rhodospirillaceae bacterium]|tara:strand:- start:94 stop:741 length:648 start_codon:yes stop_codon:yes gene_type:complete